MEIKKHNCSSCISSVKESSITGDVCKNVHSTRNLKKNSNHDKFMENGYTMIAFKSYRYNIIVLVSWLFLFVLPTGINANTTAGSSNDTTTTTPVVSSNVTGKVTVTEVSDIVPKAVITVAALIVFFAAAIGIAKLVDYCHDRRAISDDASDISDYTKELLKAQMMMLIFNRGRKKGKKLKPEEAAIKYAKVWRAKVARNKARSLKAQKEARIQAEKDGKDPEAAASKAAQQADKKRRAEKISSNSKTNTNQPSKLTTVNELNQAPPGASAKSGPIVTPRPTTSQDSKKGSSRPISAGLKSRPSSSKSAKFKAFGKFMVKR